MAKRANIIDQWLTCQAFLLIRGSWFVVRGSWSAQPTAKSQRPTDNGQRTTVLDRLRCDCADVVESAQGIVALRHRAKRADKRGARSTHSGPRRTGVNHSS